MQLSPTHMVFLLKHIPPSYSCYGAMTPSFTQVLCDRFPGRAAVDSLCWSCSDSLCAKWRAEVASGRCVYCSQLRGIQHRPSLGRYRGSPGHGNLPHFLDLQGHPQELQGEKDESSNPFFPVSTHLHLRLRSRRFLGIGSRVRERFEKRWCRLQ